MNNSYYQCSHERKQSYILLGFLIYRQWTSTLFQQASLLKKWNFMEAAASTYQLPHRLENHLPSLTKFACIVFPVAWHLNRSFSFAPEAMLDPAEPNSSQTKWLTVTVKIGHNAIPAYWYRLKRRINYDSEYTLRPICFKIAMRKNILLPAGYRSGGITAAKPHPLKAMFCQFGSPQKSSIITKPGKRIKSFFQVYILTSAGACHNSARKACGCGNGHKTSDQPCTPINQPPLPTWRI